MNGEEITEKIISELEKIAFADYSEAGKVLSSEISADFINQLARLEPYLPAVSQVKYVKDGVEIKFYDKLKALELLGKYVKGQNSLETESDFDNLLQVLQKRAGQIWKGGDTD